MQGLDKETTSLLLSSLEPADLLSSLKPAEKSSRACKNGLFFMTVLALAGFGSHYRSQQGADATELHKSAKEKAHMQSVFEIIITQETVHTLSCSNSTYAFCGDASCKAASEGIAACGCKKYTDKVGEFSMDRASSTLIRSLTYREGVLLAGSGNKEAAEKKVGAKLKRPRYHFVCRPSEPF